MGTPVAFGGLFVVPKIREDIEVRGAVAGKRHGSKARHGAVHLFAWPAEAHISFNNFPWKDQARMPHVGLRLPYVKLHEIRHRINSGNPRVIRAFTRIPACELHVVTLAAHTRIPL